MKRTTKLVVIFTVIVLFVSILWGVWFVFVPHQRLSPIVKELAREGQRIASPLESAPLDSTSNEDDRIAAAMEAATDSATSDKRTRAQILEGLTTVAEFFAARSSPDPDVYINWAHGEGLQFITGFPQTPSTAGIKWDVLYRMCTGADPAEPLTPELIFRANHTHQSSVHQGALRPVGLVVDPQGIEIDITEFTHFADNFDAFSMVHGDGFDPDFWYGGSSMGAIRFFEQDRDLKTILKEYGSTLAMRVRMISVGATGIRIPTHLTLYRDPKDEKWRIHDIHIQNVSWDSGLGLDKMFAPLY